MISISIYRNNKKEIKRFTITGHAYAAEPGKDVVCAAVSVLSQTTVLALYEIAGIDIKYEIKAGYLSCQLPAILPEKQQQEAKLLLASMVLGLKNIEETYSSYIELHDKEV